MVLHICPKCDKHFNKKDTYNKHINRKNPCVPDYGRLDKMDIKISELQSQTLELEKIIELQSQTLELQNEKIDKLTKFIESLEISE